MSQKLGPTREFPRGKLDASDEGGLLIGMAIQDKTLVINFGAPVRWIGLDLETAERFAAHLGEHIERLRKGGARSRLPAAGRAQ